MDFDAFLTRVIDEGIAAAFRDYARPQDRDKQNGAVAGFETCRGLDPEGLRVLLERSAATREAARRIAHPRYWMFAGLCAEVEWVCNVVSALLVNDGHSPLASHLPTARGVMKAAEIVGVREAV